MGDNNAKELIKRGDRMFQRPNVLALWQEIGDQFYPERAEFTVDRLGNVTGLADHLFATDPVLMRRDLGNAFSSMLRPRGREWFKLDCSEKLKKDNPEVLDWLDMASTVMRRAIYDKKARFVRATKEADHDFAAFGNAVISIEADYKTATLRYRAYHLRDCAWYENHDGIVDNLCRRIIMEPRQVKQKFSLPTDKIHQKIHEACEKDRAITCTILHFLMPSDDYEYITKKGKPKKAYVSVYVDKENCEVIRETETDHFSYIVPRWAMVTGTPYAVSPAAIVALPDSRMMQSLARIIQEAGEKSIDPPLKATEEAIKGEVNMYAGGITWVDREYDEKLGPAIEPMLLGKDAGLGIHMFDRIQLVLQNAWYLSKLSLPQQQAKTAFETAQLVEEFIRGAVPLFEPAETEYNLPLLDLTAELLITAGAMGNPQDFPQALQGRELSFSFSNPLQDASEKAKVLQYQTVTQLFAMGAQIDPGIKADLDMRTAFRDATNGAGAPADWLVDKKEADAANEQIAQQAQIQQGIGAVGAAGLAGKAVGDAVSSFNGAAPNNGAAGGLGPTSVQ